jgi:hypothetical protein
MKRAGLVILGIIASGIVYWLLFRLLTKLFGHIGEEGMLISVFYVTPLAFLIGSFPTGYFSYYDIEDKWSLTLMAPALYVNLCWITVAVLGFLLNAFMGNNTPGRYGFLVSFLLPIGVGLYWYLASAGGVFLGYYLRERFAKWWYGD